LLIEYLNVWGILIQGFLTGLTGLTGSIAFSVSPALRDMQLKPRKNNLAFSEKKAKETYCIVCSVMNIFASADLVFPLSSGKGKRKS